MVLGRECLWVSIRRAHEGKVKTSGRNGSVDEALTSVSPVVKAAKTDKIFPMSDFGITCRNSEEDGMEAWSALTSLGAANLLKFYS